MSADGAQKRNFFRLDYYPPDRPRLTITGMHFAVKDLSEKGVKFEIPHRFRPKKNAWVRGVIRLPDKTKHEILGYVLRSNLETRDCVLYLEEGLPLSKMLEEQRRLIQIYKR